MFSHRAHVFEVTRISGQEPEHRSTSNYAATITGHRSYFNEMTP